MSTIVTSNLTPKEENVESVKCKCCGLIEECTLSYKETTMERYNGKWLCGEAVQDDAARHGISVEEATTRHLSFRNNFKNPNYHGPTLLFVSAMRRVLERRAAKNIVNSFSASPENGLFGGSRRSNS